MSGLSAKKVALQHFAAAAALDGDRIVVSLKGNADVLAQDALKTLLDQADADAKRLHIAEMLIDVAELYFMNSSCLSLLMRRINELLLAGERERYKMRFRSNPNLRWQRRSFMALQSAAPAIVVLE